MMMTTMMPSMTIAPNHEMTLIISLMRREGIYPRAPPVVGTLVVDTPVVAAFDLQATGTRETIYLLMI